MRRLIQRQHAGSQSSAITVVTAKPKVMLVAMGIRNGAWRYFSSIRQAADGGQRGEQDGAQAEAGGFDQGFAHGQSFFALVTVELGQDDGVVDHDTGWPPQRHRPALKGLILRTRVLALDLVDLDILLFDHRRARFGGFLWTGVGQISLLILAEDGGSGYWYRAEGKYALTDALTVGILEERFNGPGGIAEQRLNQMFTLRLRLYEGGVGDVGLKLAF